jgi:hypothetical protein
MAQLDPDAHDARIAKDVLRLLCAFSACIVLAVCAGVGVGWMIWAAP